jgi:cobalt-zinc-cadmium efflux system membrane fusion protein
MIPAISSTVGPRAQGLRTTLRKGRVRGWIAVLCGIASLVGVAYWYTRPWFPGDRMAALPAGRDAEEASPQATQARATSRDSSVRLSPEQQRSIGLRTETVVYGATPRVTSAPGRVAPNENQYAFITPRAAGVVRSVTAHIGQEVKAGDLLATIDSPVVGEARLELYTRLQALEIAASQAAWQALIYANTVELLSHLKKGETPEQVHDSLQDRAVGANRERLMTAYAQYRLARATIERNRDLYAQKLITPKDFEQVNASFEVAQATYQSLIDEMGYEVKLDNTRAQQARRQAETAVRAARERLRILGVKPDGTEPPVEGGKVVGVKPDGTIPSRREAGADEAEKPETVLPPDSGSTKAAVKPLGVRPDSKSDPADTPVSTYSIWAPFEGTILDREMIVPGVAVDTTHRIFTMANLATVWIEASVHEADFEMLDRIRKRGGQVRFRSPAYPGRVFEGEMIYSGDLVEEQSRSVKLLARAENPERLLRPGMFVEVEVLSPRPNEVAQIPASAMLTDGGKHFVYVKTGPDRFDRRDVDAETPRGESVTIRSGLEAGDQVVVEGGYKLKAVAVQLVGARG